MSKHEMIEKVVSLAKSYVGTSEEPKGSNRNRFAKMIDEKFPDFYNGKKNGSAWCDEFVDAIFLESFGEEEALRLLCQPKKSCGAGCKFSAQYYKKAGRFFDKPEVGDQIFFYVGGDINHTGIVIKVDDNKVYTIEGNSGDMVKDHSYNKEGNKKIAGYGRPRWSIEEVASNIEQPTQKPQNATKLSEEEIALQVINGMWGNGKERKQRLTEAGYDYDAIQKIINKKLGSSSKPAPVVSEPAVKKPKTFTGIVNTIKDPLRIREGAGTQFRVLRLLPKGSKIELYTEKVNGWYKLADGSGYVAANLIRGG